MDQVLKSNVNLLFDREGSDGFLAEMIAGGNYFVKAEPRSMFFFMELSRLLRSYFATDNNIMSSLCHTGYRHNKCAFMPYRENESLLTLALLLSIISNWRWHYTLKQYIPALLQFDGGSGQDGKYLKFQLIGAQFVEPSSLGRNSAAVCDVKKSAAPEEAVPEWRLKSNNSDAATMQGSINVFQGICEWICDRFPMFRFILRLYIIPYYAYFITA
ncbi:unnamed protein product [Gongylonema pulchrum]|uniref:Nucleotid_trans domain-containing protein n=1 Tax=Gongylonema pulchrum TaxID=637853 RepID=A0A183EL20_9BILA|nr:unnamed protein product [Gongylonema pulchrum]